MNKYFAVAKVNFKRSVWIAYLVAAITFTALLVDMIVDVAFLSKHYDQSSIALSSMLYLVCALAPIFIASVNYSKLMNIGVKKKTYFYACIINYVVFAAAVSLVATLEHYLLVRTLNKNLDGYSLLSIISAFKWDTNVLTCFISQFAFLLLIEITIHTLTFMQTRWYGLVADLAIIIFISVFIPITPLRNAWLFFFRMTIFIKPSIVQALVCIALSAAFYATNLFYLKARR